MANANGNRKSVESVVVVVRALVSSRKGPCTLRSLLRDYEHVENESLPFKALGYGSAEELLRKSGEFIFHQAGTELQISNRPNEKSQHIATMVRYQKTSNKPPMRPRHPKRPDLSWNKSSYAMNMQKPPSRRVRYSRAVPIMPPPMMQQMTAMPAADYKNAHHQYEDANNNVEQQQQQEYWQQSTANVEPMPMNANELYEASLAKNDIYGNTMQFSLQQQQAQDTTAANVRPILGNNPYVKVSPPNYVNKFLRSKPDLFTRRGWHAEQQQQLKQQFADENARKMPLNIKSIQSRLKFHQQQHEQSESTAADVTADTTNKTATANHQQLPSATVFVPKLNELLPLPKALQKLKNPNKFNFDLKLSNIENLRNYCTAHKFPPPEYYIFKSSKTSKYWCRVHINDCIYSTHPHEFRTKNDAELFCASQAIAKLREQMQRNSLPVFTGSDTELLGKIYDIVAEHDAGIFAHYLPAMFEDDFQRTLPDHWWQMIQTSLKFKFEIIDETKGTVIILAKSMEEIETIELALAAQAMNLDSHESTSEHSNGTNYKTHTYDDEQEQQTNIDVNALQTAFIVGAAAAKEDKMLATDLPWDTKFWSIFITYCVSTTEIYGQLFSNNDKLLELEEKLQAHMMGMHNNRAASIKPQGIYLLYQETTCLRVRVEQIAGSSVLIKFIDYGDANWVQSIELYECPNYLLSDAALAVRFSLFGLEDFAGHPKAPEILKRKLHHKSVVAEILKSSYEYDENQKPVIPVALYDTTGAEDQPINPQLISDISNEDAPPKLKSQSLNDVNVTHVSDNGDIYAQIKEQPGLLYIQNLIEKIIASKFSRSQHRQKPEELSCLKPCLVHDEGGLQCKWFRALVTTEHKPLEQKYEMFYMDYGMTRMVDINNIYCLESLSTACSKYPGQALVMRLYGIPDTDNFVVCSMRALLPINYTIMVKLVEYNNEGMAMVKVFDCCKNGLRCVNQQIISEYMNEHDAEQQNELANMSLPQTPEQTTPIKQSKPIVKQEVVDRKVFNDKEQHLRISVQNNVTENQAKEKATNATVAAEQSTKLPMYTGFPNLNEFFEVRVVLAYNPGNFVVQPYNQINNFNKLMIDLQTYCNEQEHDEIPAEQIQIGEAYAARNAMDNLYYRVTVIKRLKEQNVFFVFFCDYGDKQTVRAIDLIPLSAELRQLPKLAIQARLNDIYPIQKEWSVQDCKHFCQLVENHNFMAALCQIDGVCAETQVAMVSIELIDVSSEEDIFISQVLKDENPCRVLMKKQKC